MKGIESIRAYRGGFQNSFDREVYYEEMERLGKVFEIVKKIDKEEALKTKALSRKWKDLTYIPKNVLLDMGLEARRYILEGQNYKEIQKKNEEEIINFGKEILKRAELYKNRFRELKVLAEQGEIRLDVKMNVDKEGEVDIRRLNKKLGREVRIGFFGVPLMLIHHGHIFSA